MSHQNFRNYLATFLTAFVAVLFVTLAFNYVMDELPRKPVITHIGTFPICGDNLVMGDKGRYIVKPGQNLCYIIHYHKTRDIPGDISKQLIVFPFDGGREYYVPLGDSAGHLPVGDIEKKAYVRIPETIPEGVGVLKLSAAYNLGGKRMSYDIAWTQEFEIRR